MILALVIILGGALVFFIITGYSEWRDRQKVMGILKSIEMRLIDKNRRELDEENI